MIKVPRNVNFLSIPLVISVIWVIYALNIQSGNNLSEIRTGSSIESPNSSFRETSNLTYEYPVSRIPAHLTFDKRWIKYLYSFGFLEMPEDESASGQAYPPFVTAFSDNHYMDGIQFLLHINSSSANESMNNFTVIFYDLGLRRSRVDKIRRSFGHFVQIRQFPFQHFPPYVAKLKEYRWKSLIVADVLRTHSSIWWMDASVRVRSLRNLTAYYEDLRSCTLQCRFDLVFQFPAGHSIYATTVPGIYDYFPIDHRKAIETEMFGATVFLVVKRSQAVMERVIRWWVLCSLEEKCMAPWGHTLSCEWPVPSGGAHGSFAFCHRYDQSALNILMANENGYVTEKYVLPTDAVVIDRLQ